jgi:hypothetical protein
MKKFSIGILIVLSTAIPLFAAVKPFDIGERQKGLVVHLLI